MPVVFRKGRFKILIYNPPREHGPAHVHVIVDATDEAVIALSPVSVARLSPKIKRKDVFAAVRLVEAQLELLESEWRRIHG